MTTYIYTFYNFHSILILPKKRIESLDSKLSNLIPFEWKLILMNEGSFTQTLHSLDNKKINIKMCQKTNNISKNLNRNIRCVWLENSIYTKFIFARSIWLMKYLKNIDSPMIKNQPIGTSLIESQIDIYKQIHEIYYGYSKEIEKKLTKPNIKALWGRKYTLYYNHISCVTIQEFFSPDILNLFY
uniref:Putative chloroplast RF21 n=1 Tax=Cumathamnion serrulatum TaxID=1206573 RepID=A0A7U1G3Z9_9FLOR|nr:putative chloroplast RF21 [Cumathamnion serrulatum]QQY85327.1 putative chloroplast RF21 [Cumathamnion serrulatum]